MTGAQYEIFKHYIDMVLGVAIAQPEPLRTDLIGIAVGLSNQLEELKREGQEE